jgi:3-deoxy-D-manno-octulosonic acid (KDO) 8-phosphate synthase
MPVPIKRRAYLEILGLGKVKITNSYDNKIFTVEKGANNSYHVRSVDLVTLKETKSPGPFYAQVIWDENYFMVQVFNTQENENGGLIGGVSTAKGWPREKDFRTIVIED